ncbi:alcohol dehydrogenase catalytic domain-containing protein [Umezawaea sp. NPDC059074]|uniref:alcohol dehydrogenase catalytic domain-containing protein n=1 Tax=Umezawaea sp. NPDC059074 TaxID=3346716 RepID=UPI00368C5F93
MTASVHTGPAIVLRPGGTPVSETVHVVPPARGQVQVDVRATGVCHSDLHLVTGDWPVDRPLVLGHEGAGVVSAVGEGVTAFAEGDRVVLSWYAPCRACRFCGEGRAWLCTGTTALDNTLPGGGTPFTDARGDEVWPYLGLGTFSGRVVVPESAVVAVDPAVPFEVGALLGCSVTTGVGAVLNTARVVAGRSAVVVGCGGVGLSVIMGLRLAGADPIIAADLSEHRLATARKMGATHTVDTRSVDLTAAVADLCGGADYAFEAAGRVELIELLPALLGRGGTGVLVGMPGFEARASFTPYDLADQGKSLLGCNYGSSVAEVDVPRLARLYLDGRLPLDLLLGSVRPLADAPAALDELRRGIGLRSILIPDDRTGAQR